MPSDLMNSEQFVNSDQIQTKTVKIVRINNTNSIGARMWFVLQDQDGVLYQRWSLLMDETDATLAIAQAGDIVKISYWIEKVTDPQFQRVADFTRYNLTLVEFSRKK